MRLLPLLLDCGLKPSVQQPSDEGHEKNRSLFIKDLSKFVSEEALTQHITKIYPVKSVRLCRHPETQAS
jgi:hypothetical protein